MFCFIWVSFLLRCISLVSKSVFVTKFVCANLSVKLAVKLLNSELGMYLSW